MLASLKVLLLAALTLVSAQAGIRCPDALLDDHWQPPAYSHILVRGDGGFDVLLPEEGDSLRVMHVDTLPEARRLARTIDEPIDFSGIVRERRDHLDELLDMLRAFKGTDESIVLSARTKEAESFRQKIFDKARRRGTGFRLTDIDDVLGARLAVGTQADIAATIARLRALPGLETIKVEPVAYDRGYRATHLTVRATSGTIFEIQVMTHRMLSWVSWNARRVYKPLMSRSSPYFQRLKSYDAEIIAYLNALDAGTTPGPRRAH
jgi:ppGpp synthetase/RelA/SpoT-type nucleotidyltranferase